jgi:hypothetical protein
MTAAVFSRCGRFRYWLERDLGDPLFVGTRANLTATFVMLNPSTADAVDDDPTIRRCRFFAREKLRASRLIVVNLYAFRATDPRALVDAGYPVGPENDHTIARALREATAGVVVAWGTLAQPARVEAFRALADIVGRTADLLCLRRTADGSPGHPLYIPSSVTPEPWP